MKASIPAARPAPPLPGPPLPARLLLSALLLSVLVLPAGAARAEPACAGDPAGTRLVVRVEGVRAAAGQVVVTVYPDDARRFLAPHGKLLRQRVAASAPETRACFELPGPGSYAVAVYHDGNGDGRFNRTLVGLPAEGFGFSNDAPTRTGLPAFSAVRFPVRGAETTSRLTLRYLR